jgi:hypothetical protein
MNQQNKLEGISKPRRVKHRYTQSIKGTPEQVFPLLCPVRETNWIPGWTTDWVISNSGSAEQNCIFQTPPRPGAGGVPSIWVITRHDADAFEVEMYKVTPAFTVGHLQISLSAQGKTGTDVTIAYEFTSLGPLGDEYLEAYTAQWYEKFMQVWESQMNHYLETGELISEPDLQSA